MGSRTSHKDFAKQVRHFYECLVRDWKEFRRFDSSIKPFYEDIGEKQKVFIELLELENRRIIAAAAFREAANQQIPAAREAYKALRAEVKETQTKKLYDSCDFGKYLKVRNSPNKLISFWENLAIRTESRNLKTFATFQTHVIELVSLKKARDEAEKKYLADVAKRDKLRKELYGLILLASTQGKRIFKGWDKRRYKDYFLKQTP